MLTIVLLLLSIVCAGYFIYQTVTTRALLVASEKNLGACLLSDGFDLTSLTTCRTNLTACGNTVTDLQAKINNCTGDLATSNGSLATCTTGLAICTGDLATKQHDLDTCTAGLGTCTGALKTCNAGVTDLQAQINSCTGALATSNGSLATCTGGLATCNGALATKQHDLDTCNQGNGIGLLQQQVKTCNDSLAAAKGCAADLAACNTNFKASQDNFINCQNHPSCPPCAEIYPYNLQSSQYYNIQVPLKTKHDVVVTEKGGNAGLNCQDFCRNNGGAWNDTFPEGAVYAYDAPSNTYLDPNLNGGTQVVCGCVNGPHVVKKDGNNGSVSCQAFCTNTGGTWGTAYPGGAVYSYNPSNHSYNDPNTAQHVNTTCFCRA